MSTLTDTSIDKKTTHQPQMRPFSLRVDFLATSLDEALNQAEAYVESLILLRPEVDCFTASVADTAAGPEPKRVYCGAHNAADPGDICTRRSGHGGRHVMSGVAIRWRNDRDRSEV